MPVQKRCDDTGCFFRWGDHGKKYFFDPKSDRSINVAHEKAARQGRAIKASQMKRFYHYGGNYVNNIDGIFMQQYHKYKQQYLQLKKI